MNRELSEKATHTVPSRQKVDTNSMNETQETPCEISGMTVAYRERVVLKNVTFTVPEGAVMGILGANGAGKSTLLKSVMQLIPRLAGEAKFFGEDLARARKRVGYMPQSAEVDWDFPTTVFDVVLMGTYARLGWFARPGKAEREAAHRALQQVGIDDLAGRQISQLSGGQKQRTFLARALAQNPDLFLMDEPFAGVDAASEKAIMSVLAGLREQGKTIMIVHHDLATVKDFCTHVALLHTGDLVAAGSVAEAFTTHNIHRAYGIMDEIPVEAASV